MTVDIEIQWTGTDGSVWDLRHGDVRLSDAGIAGLGMPLFQIQSSDSAVADGQTVEGFKVLPRSVLLPVRFRTPSPAIQSAFWRSVSPFNSGMGKLTVGRAGIERTLGLRFEDDGGVTLKQDPDSALSLNEIWPLSFTADNPLWAGTEVATSYSSADFADASFFGDLGGPPFNIASNNGGVTTLFANPGDAPAWVTFEAEGELTRFYAFMDGQLVVDASMAVGEGSVLTVVTDPISQFADLDGLPVNWRLSTFEPRPVSPEGTYLSMTTFGTGRVRARFTPRYLRGY